MKLKLEHLLILSLDSIVSLELIFYLLLTSLKPADSQDLH